MKHEEISQLLKLLPLADTPELLDELAAAEETLREANEAYGDDRYTLEEGGSSIGGMWDDLQSYAAGGEIDLTSRVTVFDDSAEVAGWFAELATENAGESDLYTWAASRLLALYGLMALAAKEQAEEANADRNDEEYLA
jgi:hypothetical protein